MVLYNEKIKHLSCSDLRVFLKRLVKDKIEKEWTEDFIDSMNLVIIPRMTIKRRYENKGIDMSRLIDNPTYYQHVKKSVDLEAILNLKIGKIFRISHLVDFNKLMLARTLSSFEMGLMKSKIFYIKGEAPKH